MMRSNTGNEARHYWRLMRDVADARMNGASSDELADLADEIDVLREMSDWPTLKDRCSKMLAEIVPEKQFA